MSLLLTLRQDLVAALAGLDLNTYTHVPGAVALPGAFISAAGPLYIEQGDTYESRLVRFDVNVVTQTGDNQSETEELDALIEGALTALEANDWMVESVSVPTIYSFSDGALGLVTQITVTTLVTFTN